MGGISAGRGAITQVREARPENELEHRCTGVHWQLSTEFWRTNGPQEVASFDVSSDFDLAGSIQLGQDMRAPALLSPESRYVS